MKGSLGQLNRGLGTPGPEDSLILGSQWLSASRTSAPDADRPERRPASFPPGHFRVPHSPCPPFLFK